MSSMNWEKTGIFQRFYQGWTLARHVQHGSSPSAARGRIRRSGLGRPTMDQRCCPTYPLETSQGTSPIRSAGVCESRHARAIGGGAKSADDGVVVVMASVSYVCFLRAGEVASVGAGDVHD